MGEDERYSQGDYASEAEAILACQKIVNEFLLHAFKPGMTSQELFEMYVGFGEDPWIQGGDFSAWNYAKLRSEEILRPNNET
jgi:hypothetical protein